MNNILKLWLLPFLFATGTFFMIRPTFAQITDPVVALSLFLAVNDVFTGLENKDGYTQVYYEYNSERKLVSSDSINKRHPDSKGEYIAYVGDINEQGQIFLYNIISGISIQITNSGVNLEPKVNRKGQVVWESWIGDRRQMYLFDGTSVSQITQGDLATNADIEGDNVIYARQDLSGTWRAEIYSLKSKKKVDVTTGDSAQYPKLSEGKILLKNGLEQFSLTADDLFLLNLVPLAATDSAQTVTLYDIAQEIEASVSAEIETGSSPTPSQQ